MPWSRVLAACLAAGALAAAVPAAAQHNQLTAQQRSDGWKLLFDGKTTAGWRNYLKPGISDGWQVQDGELRRVGQAGDIVTVGTYTDFELDLEFKVAPGGNSGIFFHVVEDSTLGAVYLSGPEMQILDDAAHADGLKPETSIGSNYALHAPSASVAKAPGEWNHARIVVRGDHVEHWLNGTKIVAYELGSADWERRVQASKFKDMPKYGRARSGHIALQDHGDSVAFRNIRIRELK